MNSPWRVAVAGGAALVAVALLGGTAYADPSVADVEAQIDALWTQAEPLIEQYDATDEQYQANKAQQATLEAQIAPLQAQIDAAGATVGVVAAQAYQSNTNIFTALISSGSPGQLADELTYLSLLSHDQRAAISGVLDLKAQYDAQKAPIDALTATLAAQDADLSQRKQDIEAKLSQLQDLRRQVGADNGTSTIRPAQCPAEYAPTPGYQAAAFACAQIGASYVWDAAGPNSYDCSGLTMMSWRQVGVYLPHNAAQQRASMPYVNRADLQLGDLVFYYSNLEHVGIYVGNGWVVDAPTYGIPVEMQNIDKVAPINSYGRPA